MSVAAEDLERGRTALLQHSWEEAFTLLTRADAVSPLCADDLGFLAGSAYCTGRMAVCADAHRRSYAEHQRRNNPRGAAMCAYSLYVLYKFKGEQALAAGWLARAQRLLKDAPECVEQGYVLVARATELYYGGELEDALPLASRATEIGGRFADADLAHLGLHTQGCALVRLGRTAEGMKLIDESMVGEVAGELSPPYTIWIYCHTIGVCRMISDGRRAAEWTAALERWAATQTGAVLFSAGCRLHRAEIMQLHGACAQAEQEARLACEQLRSLIIMDAAEAQYLIGEIRRLVGDLPTAEAAFVEASRLGREPQAGLARLRMAQGRVEAAGATIRRALAEPLPYPLARAALLPVQVEIALASGQLREARAAAEELQAMASDYAAEVGATSNYALGLVQLAEGDAKGALASLRQAWRVWRELDIPYEAAHARLHIGLACRALGDEDTARLEFDAAWSAFKRLGAKPDQRRAEKLLGKGTTATLPGGLTDREAEVLALVAAGMSNRRIATELSLSEKTVARHLNNIFLKIEVSSRAAATAYAYENKLVSGAREHVHRGGRVLEGP